MWQNLTGESRTKRLVGMPLLGKNLWLYQNMNNSVHMWYVIVTSLHPKPTLIINYLNWSKHGISQLISILDVVVWIHARRQWTIEITEMWMFSREQWKTWIVIRCLLRGLLHKLYIICMWGHSAFYHNCTLTVFDDLVKWN